MTASSKPPFAGEVRRVRLGDVCELTMGQSPSSDTYNREGVGLPFFQGNADFGAAHPLPSVWCSAPRKIAEPGDILLSVRAPIGEVNIANVRCCIGRGIAALRLNSKCIVTSYLCAQILARKALLESMGTGSTFKAVGKKTLKSFPLVVHSRERQSLVVEQLDGVSRCLDLARRQLSLLDELVKSRFVEMFGDPDLKDRGFETALGKNLFKIGNGKSRPADKRFNEGVPAYGGNGVSWYTDETLVDFDTIVIGRVGRHCGNTRLVKAPFWVTDNAMYIKKFKRDCFDKVFLINLMNIIAFNRFADEGDLWKISQKPFVEYEYPIPPLSLQREFAAFAAEVAKSRVAVRQKIEKLQTLYDSLSQEYFG